MGDIDKNTLAISEAMREQYGATNDISNSAIAASSGAQTAKSAMANVSMSVDKNVSAAADVMSAVDEVSKEAADLQSMIDSFLTDVAAA